ncbi:MAG: hypothetical protein LBD21_08545 [Tannerellaceae bacterium]|jgi:hypothetical protein|nr:hypothetical protein [Tannerellaceae bacterium]
MSKSNSKKKPEPKPNAPAMAMAASQKTFPFVLIGLIFMGLSLFFSFSPLVTRGWGLNYMGFFDVSLAIPLYLLMLLAWYPATNAFIVKKLSGITGGAIISFCRKYRYVLFAIVAIAASFAFYFLKIKYIFLGDTDLRPEQIQKGEISKDEYLTMLSIQYLYHFLRDKFEYTCIQTFQLVDYVTGGLFVFVSLCIANQIGKSLLKKLAVFCIATLSLPLLLVFCGYTEIYMVPALLLTTYLFTAILYVKGRINVAVPILLLLVSIAFHLMLVCMLPSLIFLIYAKGLWKYPLFRKKWMIISLLAVSAPFIFMGFKKFALPLTMPLWSSDGYMTMFSNEHYVEFFNSQMMGAGIGFLIWLTILIYSLVHKIKYDILIWFLQIASVSITGLLFVFVMSRGSGDWDIGSFAALVYNLSNAVFLLYVYENRIYRNVKYGALMIAVFSIIHTASWIYTNKTDASILWVESAFSTDPAIYYRATFNNESMVTAVFSANKLYDRAAKWGKIAYDKYIKEDPRMGYNYARDLVNLHLYDEARTVLEDNIKMYPLYAPAYDLLIDYYLHYRQYEQLYRILGILEHMYKQVPEAFTTRMPQEKLNHYFSILNDMRSEQPAGKE